MPKEAELLLTAKQMNWLQLLQKIKKNMQNSAYK